MVGYPSQFNSHILWGRNIFLWLWCFRRASGGLLQYEGMPKLIVPPPYRGPTRGLAVLEVTGGTVRACVDSAEEAHPGLAELVYDEASCLHGFVRLFLNGDRLMGEDVLTLPVGADDELEIVAAIAGG